MSHDEFARTLPERIASALEALPQDEAIAARIAEARRQAVQVAEMRARLEGESLQVGPEVLSRLQAARRAAVQRSRRRGRRPTGRFVWAGAAVAAAALLVAVGPLLVPDRGVPPLYESDAEELAVEEMDLLEDMEFIAWLEAEESRTSSDPGPSDRAG